MNEVGSTYIHRITPFLKPKPPQIPFASSVTTTFLHKASDFGPEYWQENLQKPVLFRQAIGRVIRDGVGDCPIIEVGPHSTLAGPMKQIFKENGMQQLSYTSVLKRNSHAVSAFMSALGHLYCWGVSNILLPLTLEDGAAPPTTPLTDFPPYSWNLSENCYNPRSTRALREWNFPRSRPHELLGQRVWSSCDAVPQWRCFVSPEATPWVLDHCIRREVVFPAAAYLAMAGELVMQLAEGPDEKRDRRICSGFVLRDVRIETALVLCRGQRVELLTKAYSEQLIEHPKDPKWWEVSVWSLSSGQDGRDDWVKHFACRAKAVDQNHVVNIPPQMDPLAVKMENFQDSHLRLVNTSSWYKALRRVGYNYGPQFRATDGIRAATTSSEAYCSVKAKFDDDLVSTSLNGECSYVMHPTMIDHMLQALIVAGHSGEPRRMDKLWLPTMIEEVFIARERSSTSCLSTERLRIEAEARNFGQGLVLGLSGLENASPKELTAWMKGVNFSPLTSWEVDSVSKSQYVFDFIAKPDIDLIDPSILIKPRSKPGEIEPILHDIQALWDLYARELRRSCLRFALEEDAAIKTVPSHLKKHCKWIQHYEPKECYLPILRPEIDVDLPLSRRDELLATLQDTPAGPAAKLLDRCHRHAQALFTGEMDPLELLYQDHGLQDLYDWMNSLWCYEDFFKLISHKHGRCLKILEIGAGTGGLTARALKYLTTADPEAPVSQTCQQDVFPFGKYVFTDISAAFFKVAKARFAWVPSHLMDYAVLDISRDPCEQGFQPAEYDLIIASNVLHATPNLQATLDNVRMLLKPDGRLLMQELACADMKWINFIMGFLPGWWSGQEDPDQRLHEPYLSPTQWNRRLVDADFNAAEAIVYDAKPPLQLNATILARPSTSKSVDLVPVPQAAEVEKTESESSSRQGLSLLVPLCDDPSVMKVVDHLYSRLRKRGWTVSLLNMDQHLARAEALDEGHVIVSTLDLFEQDGWFFDMSEYKLKAFQQLINAMQAAQATMLWLTRPCQISSITNPNFALCLGVARTVRVESDLPFVTLEIDDFDHDGAEEAIHRVIKSLCLDAKNQANKSETVRDMEYFVTSKGRRKANIFIPRARPISVPRALADPTRKMLHGGEDVQAIDPPQYALSLTTTGAGSIENLLWCHRTLSSLPAKEVEIRIQASGLNFKDVVATMGIAKNTGLFPSDGFSTALGCEAAGTVTVVGASVSHVAAGDRVLVFAPHAGCFSTKVRVDARLCVRIPDKMTMIEAAGMPCVFITVIRSLIDKTNLRPGHTVLIHSAGGGVGVAALQLARYLGVTPPNIYATTGSMERRTFLIEEWQIPSANIFSSRDDRFVDGISNATHGRGVDVVLNSLSGDLLHASWRCVAAGGTMVELGKRDIASAGKISLVPFDDNRTFTAVDMARLAEQEPDVVGRLLNDMIQLHEQGAISCPQPLKVAPYEEIKNAFRHLSADGHVGKIVIDMKDCGNADGVLIESLVPTFDPNGIYLLIGGLGGLGKCIARWMVSHGAKTLFFVSRSAGRGHEQDTTLLKELRSLGCEAVALPCDISDEDEVNACISAICTPFATPKRIAGVMFLPMILADAALPDMSVEKWRAASNPKVKGAWNVHRALMATKDAPRHLLDFFILFSSMSGLCGFPGQVNYAAANSFLDAFSLYRHGIGLPCAVLDLGPIEDVGYVSESPDIQDKMIRAGAKLVTERELLAALQLAISPSNNTADIKMEKDALLGTRSVEAQLAVGFEVTLPLEDPENAVVWKHDARLLLHRPKVYIADGVDSKQPSNSSARSESMDCFMRLCNAPTELDSESTRRVLAMGILTHVLSLLSREQQVDAKDLEKVSWASLGADSLVTIEMKGWWRRIIGGRITSSQLSNSASFLQLADVAIGQLQRASLK